MYIQLDLGWMHHPFPVSSFRIGSAEQIATLRELGLTSVKVLPKRAIQSFAMGCWPPLQIHLAMQPMARRTPAAPAEQPASPRQASRQRCAAECCSQLRTRRSSLVTGGFGRLPSNTCRWKSWWPSSPSWLRQKGSRWLPVRYRPSGNVDSAIRPFRGGETRGLAPVNVMVLSLLLGKALGMKSAELHGIWELQRFVA